MAAKTTKKRLAGVVLYKGRYHAKPKGDLYAGSWLTPQEAAVARDRVILFLGLDTPLQFPEQSKELGPASAEEMRLLARRAGKDARGTSSRYYGVIRDGDAWALSFNHEGRNAKLKYDDEIAAARGHDRLLRHIKRAGPFNFPNEPLRPASIEVLREEKRQARRGTSSYRGVHFDKARSMWSAAVVAQGRDYKLGRFESERAAARAYDEVAWNLTGDASRLNFKPPNHPPTGQPPVVASRIKHSRYFGVTKMGPKFVAQVSVDGRAVMCGSWRSERAAALARDRAMLYLGREDKLNLPAQSRAQGPLSPEVLVANARFAEKKNASSMYLGVKLTRRDRWGCVVTAQGRDWTAEFTSEEEAAIGRDRIWLHFGLARTLLNFPERQLEPASPQAVRDEQRRAFKETTTSQYRGVYFNQWEGLWYAQIGADHRTIRLGSYDSEVEAAEVYDNAALKLHEEPKLNFPDRPSTNAQKGRQTSGR